MDPPSGEALLPWAPAFWDLAPSRLDAVFLGLAFEGLLELAWMPQLLGLDFDLQAPELAAAQWAAVHQRHSEAEYGFCFELWRKPQSMQKKAGQQQLGPPKLAEALAEGPVVLLRVALRQGECPAEEHGRSLVRRLGVEAAAELPPCDPATLGAEQQTGAGSSDPGASQPGLEAVLAFGPRRTQQLALAGLEPEEPD